VDHAEPIVLRLQPIDLGAVLLITVDLIPLELMERHAKPPGLHPGRFPLGHEAVLGRERVREIRIAVMDERRQPIDLGSSGQQVGLPPLLALAGLPALACLLGAMGLELLLKPCHLAPRRLGFLPERLGLAPERLDLAAERLEVSRQRGPLFH
jgi:hypothetical protein